MRSSPLLMRTLEEAVPSLGVTLCCAESLSRVRLFVTPWTVTRQAPLSMGFSRQEYWRGVPYPPPGGLPDPEIEPRSPALQADSLPSEKPEQMHLCSFQKSTLNISVSGQNIISSLLVHPESPGRTYQTVYCFAL